MRPWILIFFVFSTIFLLTETRRKQEVMKEEEEVQQQKAVVLQSDHFYSETEKSKSFDIGDIQKDKPIVFLLQQANQLQREQALQKNPVTVTLSAGKQTKKCVINHLHALCVLPSSDAQKGNFKVQCQKTPCAVKWRLQQPETIQTDGKHTVNHLVAVNQQKDHAMLKVFCTDPKIRKDLDSKIEMFTNSRYDKVVNQQGQIMYFFLNEEKGDYFISTNDKAIEKCAVAHLEHAEDMIILKKQGVEIIDFFVNHQPNIYTIDKSMQTDLRIEFLLHEAQMQVMHNTTWVQIQLIGIDGKKNTSLNKLTLDVDDEKEFITFNMIFKKPQEKHEKYEIHIKSYSENYLIATMRFVADDLHQVQFEEESYFQLKKGQKIKYQMIPLKAQEKNIQTVNFFNSDSAKFKLSKDSCDRKGCQFEVQALQSAKGFIYLGQDIKKLKAAELIEEQFQNSIGAKVSQGQQKFYLYKIKANDAIQILVNTPNVIVYAANKQLCRGQNLTKCHQKQINYHNPAIYEATQDIDLVFLVRALDSAKFVLTIVDAHAPYFQLKDTEPFVYLMDSNENTLALHFKIPQKQDVSFNLISSIRQLSMVVLNQEKLEKIDSKKQSQEGQFSSQGFIQFAKQDLKSTSFVIFVHKNEQYKGKFAHFTLIASTKESNLVLEPSNPHYQKLPAKATRDYVFGIQRDKKLFLNIHTPNSNNPQLKLKVSNVDEYNNQSNTVQFQIKEQTDVISLQTIGERLCEDRQSQCELFIRLISEMNSDVQVTLTLIIQNAIIQLKDGIWQNYDLNKAVSSAHFYFLPKHNKHSITIFYHSSLVNLKVSSTLWKSDDTSIDISEWPFPHTFKVDKSKQSTLQFKPPQFIHIDAAQLKKCWPYCVVLLSIVPQKSELNQLNKSPSPLFTINHSFRIMASNSFIKVPQKNKIDVVLNKQEDKYFLVDLKNYMDKQSVVFFTSFTIGSSQLKANVYSESNPRCPTVQEVEADFNFIGIETEIELADVKKKLQENKMNNDKSTYLCILGHAFVESKFSLQFIPEGKDIKPLQIDSTTQVKLKAEEVRLYEIHAHFQFFLKLSRTSGFPYISKKLCNPVNDMEKCLEDFIKSDEKGDQFVNKVMSLTQTSCAGCIYYLKITAKQESQLTIHAQSRFIEIQMKQNSPLTDVLAANGLNKYLITSVPDKQLLINIQITSGDLKVQVNDYNSIAIKKENKKGTNNIHIAIPPKDLKSAKTTTVSSLTSFQFSTNFVHLHLSVQSQDSKSPASYVITYSNGEPQTYLQDGLIAQYNLIPKKKTTFLYSNPSSTSIYLHLATAQAQTLNKLKVSVFALEDIQDQQSMTDLNVKKQDFQKKTVNPTMLMHLPGKSFYVIEVQNQNPKDVLLYIGVNNKQIIYLPLDHEFPFRVQPKQYMYLVISAVNAGYLRFTLNKCDDSQPYIAYTNDYNDFVNQNFQTQEQVTDSLIYDNVIKIKQAGSLYFKIRAEDVEPSTLTVKATFSPNKINLNNAKAGNKGNLQYNFMDFQTAQISYAGVVCEKNCGDFTYTAIRSDNISSIIAQLVCTSVSFDLLGFTQTKQPEIVPIKATTSKDNKLLFNLPIKQDFNYVGVKAVNSKSGAIVYYQPVEITTFKGKITKAIATASEPTNLTWIIGIVLLILICVPLFAYRRYQKKLQAYRPVGYDQMQDAVN